MEEAIKCGNQRKIEQVNKVNKRLHLSSHDNVTVDASSENVPSAQS